MFTSSIVRGPKPARLHSFLTVFLPIIIVAITSSGIVLEVAECSIFASAFLIVVTTPEASL